MTGDNTMDYLRRTWADIDLDCIVHNYRELKSRLTPGCRTMAVVKADAYGHGDGYVSRALQQEGADWFAVSNINEAISLRRQKVARPILILGCTPPEMAHTLAELGISQTVYSEEYAGELSRAAVEQKAVIDCHVKIDTGMSRIGFFAQHGHEARAAEEIARVCALPGLSCTGVFTHFACADECAGDSRDYTRMQYRSFLDTVELLEKRGITFALRHCCNSAATLRYPEMHLDMVRPGIILYGLSPAPWMEGMLPLDPVMELKTTVSMIKDLPADTPVSYGRIYTTGEARRVATVPIGYADGYPRVLSNRADMLLAGRRVRVVGRVCMDQCMLDVTGLDVRESMVATVFGRDGEAFLPVEELADHMGTINYEVVCQISKRVPRLFVRDGQVVGQLNYIVSP